MNLHVLASSSKGNCYVLSNSTEALVLEAGVRFHEVQKAVDFNTGIIRGCLVSHEHGDHAKYVKDFLKRSVNVYCSQGTKDGARLVAHRNLFTISSRAFFKIGSFTVLPFSTIHDAKEPMGFVINHKETGNILFLTDTKYSPYKFSNLNHIMIEANYIDDIIDSLLNRNKLDLFRYSRLKESHISLETCKRLLSSNDLSNVNNIVLMHLSDSHSDENRMKSEIIELTGRMVHVAKGGLSINLNKDLL